MTGYLMLNGRLAGADLIAKISGFVPQEDLAIDDLTVTEHMEFMVSEGILFLVQMLKYSKNISFLS